MPRGVAAIAGVVVIAACSSPPAEPTTVPSTSTSTTTSTTVAPTTTVDATTTTSPEPGEVKLSDPLSIDYPENPQTVDDLPAVLTDLIGAPMPEPDLSLESEADFARWLEEWIGWYTWLSANPTDDPEVLAVGFIPETDEFERQQEIARTQLEAGRRVLGWWIKVDAIRPLVSEEMFRQEVAGSIILEASHPYPSYVVSQQGMILDGSSFPERLVIALSVRNGGEGVGWRIEFLTVG